MDKKDLSPLIYSLKNKNSENLVKLFINKKTNFNQKDNSLKTPLIYSLVNKYSENLIKLMINKNTNINQRDKSGYSPLIYSLRGKYPLNLVKLLINKNTDINKRYFGLTPLMYSLKNNCCEKIIKMLIDKKSDLNQRDYFDKNTLLIYSLMYKHPKNIIKLFLNKETIYKKNKKKDSALTYLLKKYPFELFKRHFNLFEKFITFNQLIKFEIEKEKLSLILKLKPELRNKDFFNWSFLDYVFSKNRMQKIKYLLIFSN